ncbi:MAG: hypothetical protein ACOC7Y_01665, partial [Chloroflexota bacterium]
SYTGTHHTPGGSHKQDVLFAFDAWWVIGANGHVYYGTDPLDTSPTDEYTAGDAHALIPARYTTWLITSADAFHQWDRATSAFVSFYDPILPLNSRHIVHFRDYFLIIGRPNDGSLILYRLNDREPIQLRQLAYFPSETGHYQPTHLVDWSVPTVVHEDRVYFSTGAYMSTVIPAGASENQFARVPIYVFDGSSVDLLDIIEAPMVPDVWGLLTWRGRLLLYFLETYEQHIYLYTGGRFTPIIETTETLATKSDLYSVGGELLLNTVGDAYDGVQFLREPTTYSFTSSWLDMDHPTAVKFLSHVSAVIANPTADVTAKLEYRTILDDETSSWTEAVSADNQRYLLKENIGVRFRMLQLRVTFTDATSTNPDVRLENLAATYSYGIK